MLEDGAAQVMEDTPDHLALPPSSTALNLTLLAATEAATEASEVVMDVVGFKSDHSISVFILLLSIKSLIYIILSKDKIEVRYKLFSSD